MNDKIAIDIALLPPDPIMNLAIELNSEIRTGALGEIVLNKENRIPHITILMGIVARDTIEEIKEKLRTIAGNFRPLDLVITGVKNGNTNTGRSVSGLTIAISEELRKFDDAIVSEIIPFCLPQRLEAEMLASPILGDTAIEYIKDFVQNGTGEKFHPHITIGLQRLEHPVPETSFTASRLALCHLGQNHTCEKILFEINL